MFIENAPRGSKPPAIARRVCCPALGCVAIPFAADLKCSGAIILYWVNVDV